MFETNSLILASAGTGKTFALATRFIRLMMLDNVRPETIVALTFSRAAAQEIYAKILTRLSSAAASEEGAEKEWHNLMEDFERDLVPEARAKLAVIRQSAVQHGPAAFGKLLRKLLETQHMGTIATLDSFILRLVRCFPQEMGFQSAISVIDEYDSEEAVGEALKLVFGHAQAAQSAAIAAAYKAAKKGEFLRNCLEGAQKILSDGWRSFALAHPECVDPDNPWTVESMCKELGIPDKIVKPDWTGLSDYGDLRDKFIAFVESYTGSTLPGPKTVIGSLIKAVASDPCAQMYDHSTANRERHWQYGPEGALILKEAVDYLLNTYLKKQLNRVKAIFDLVAAVENVYTRTTRKAGRLTFSDFTDYSSKHDQLDLDNIAYRFDSQFDHWALDEFQDTSDNQWKCLKELVRNAAGDGHEDLGRTAMAVGDMKQAIYGWRGASERPFAELMTWPEFQGFSRQLRESHRYGPNITSFVNKVFGLENITPDLAASCSTAIENWRTGWGDHISHEPADYVKVRGLDCSQTANENAGATASDEDNGETDDLFLAALTEEVKALWDRHQDANSTETVAILVRGNTDGQNTAKYLCNHGLPAIWEGKNPLNDLPVIHAFLALLRLSEHPEDTAAWHTVETLIPIRAELLPNCKNAKEASAEIARLLTCQGLSRTLKSFVNTLSKCKKPELKPLSLLRLEQLVTSAVAFESRQTTDTSVDAFVRYLENSSRRELAASSSVIRVLTMHRAKGLGFDHVFVPLFQESTEKASMTSPSSKSPLYSRGNNWVLPHIGHDIVTLHPKLRSVYEQMCNAKLQEDLNVYYVAFTRAKKSMVILYKKVDQQGPLVIQNLITKAIGVEDYSEGEPPVFRHSENTNRDNKTPPAPWQPKGTRSLVGRISPSRNTAASGQTLTRKSKQGLFAAAYGASAREGIAVHDAYAGIEWVEGEALAKIPEAFHEAFARQSGATVWRERSYELFEEGRWETGRFDRVVFTDAESMREAVIYDFKTNSRGADESLEDFHRRMIQLYTPQMTNYRKALCTLTGLPAPQVKAALLLIATGECLYLPL